METVSVISNDSSTQSPAEDQLPLVSVVMCTYNRSDMLRDALNSLVSQETDGKFQFELVLVYGGDPAQTMDVVQEIAPTTSVEIRAVHEPRRGQVIARNRALVEARGEWLAHFDDDQIATSRWLVELINTANSQHARVVGGSLYLKLPEDCQRQLTFVCRRMLGQSVEWDSVRPYTRKEGPGTGNIMVHRTVFDKVGHFDESFQLRGYDTDLFRRIREAGYEAWFTPLAKAYHVTPESRLEEGYFKETCLHNGWSFARRDYIELGSFKATCMLFARIAHATIMHLPRWVWAKFSSSQEDKLTASIRLWRTEGYIRSALYWMLPGVFTQKRFFSKYEFRAEKVSPPNDSSERVGT